MNYCGGQEKPSLKEGILQAHGEIKNYWCDMTALLSLFDLGLKKGFERWRLPIKI